VFVEVRYWRLRLARHFESNWDATTTFCSPFPRALPLAQAQTTGVGPPLPLRLADDGQLLISVADTGVGLPAENVDRLFDAFFTTKSRGTGLGLAITRSIVMSHGGRIWATSNSGHGATFKFTLPSTLAAAA
jgi:signal transduction histidine kinase